MLVRSLSKLEQERLSHREIFKEVPARVENVLTADGKALIPVLSSMSEWSNQRQSH